MELTKVERNEEKFSSVYLTEQINVFRKEEGRSILAHKNLLAKIELEFEVEIGELKIQLTSYLDKSNRESKCYELTYDQSLELLVSESKTVRKAVLAELKRLKSIQTEEQQLLALFPNTDANLLSLTANTIRDNKKKDELIKLNAPKVDFADKVASSSDLIDIATFAKLVNDELSLGRNKMFALLRKNNILMKSNQPYQKYVDNGTFKTIEQTFKTAYGEKISIKTLITGQGQIKLLEKLRKLTK